MLLGQLQLGLADLLLQIRRRCADLIMNDVVLADSAGLLKNIPDNLADHGIHLFGTVGSRAIAVSFVLGTVITLVDGHTPITAIGGVMGLPRCRRKNAATAVTAIHIAGQQSTAGIHSGIAAKWTGNFCFAAILQRNCLCAVGSGTLSQIVRRSLLPAFLHTLELLRRDNLQVRKYLRDTLTASEYTGVSNIDENVLDGGVMERLTRAEVEKALLLECGRGFPPTIINMGTAKPIGEIQSAFFMPAPFT